MKTSQDSALPEPAESFVPSAQTLPNNQLSAAIRDVFLALFMWAASVALLLLPQFLALPYVATHYRGRTIAPEVLLADKTLILILVAGILPAHLLTLVIAWCVSTRFGKIPITKALRWQWERRVSIAKSMALAVFLFAIAWTIALAFGGKETNIERIINSSRAAALLLAFLAVTTAPLVEEIVYRGILFPAWERLTGSVTAVVIVTFMFAIPHVPQYWPNWAVIFSITLLSAVLTVVRARTGRLMPCYIIHLVFNGIQSIIIVAEPYLRPLLNPRPPETAPAFLHSILALLSCSMK